MQRGAFQKQLETKQAQGAFILYGTEGYLLDFVRRYLRDDFLDPALQALNYTRLSLAENTAALIMEAAETLPVFSDRRIVVVEDCDFTQKGMGAHKETLDVLAGYIENLPEGVLLVLIAPQETIFKGKFVKKIDAKDGVVPFVRLTEGELAAFIRRRTQQLGSRIDDDAVRLIVQRSGYTDPEEGKSLYDVEHTLQTLVSDTGHILAVQVDKILPAPFTETVFQLLDAISAARAEAALRIYSSLRADGEDVFPIFYMLVRHVRNLIRVKAHLVRQAAADGPSVLKISPFEFRKLASTAPNVPFPRLFEMVRLLYETESRLKESPAGPDTLLSALLVRLCRLETPAN